MLELLWIALALFPIYWEYFFGAGPQISNFKTEIKKIYVYDQVHFAAIDLIVLGSVPSELYGMILRS